MTWKKEEVLVYLSARLTHVKRTEEVHFTDNQLIQNCHSLFSIFTNFFLLSGSKSNCFLWYAKGILSYEWNIKVKFFCIDIHKSTWGISHKNILFAANCQSSLSSPALSFVIQRKTCSIDNHYWYYWASITVMTAKQEEKT